MQAAEQPPADATPLKRQLRLAERRKKLTSMALVLPVAVLLFVAFLWPIGALLKRGIDNREVMDGLPLTTSALKGWKADAGTPGEPVFDALAADLDAGRGTPKLAAAAKRLNVEQSGLRSLVMKTASGLQAPAEPADTAPAGDGAAGAASAVTPDAARPAARDRILAIDERWGQSEVWQAIASNASPYTPRYLLAALDREQAADGSLQRVESDQAVFVDVFARTFWMSGIVTLVCLLLGFPLAYVLATLPARISNVLMIFVLLPFWTSVLVRVAAWIVLLQGGGLVNQALMLSGVISEPLQLVFNRTGVYIAMIHILLPFMVLPLYSVMKGIPPVYMRAALSMGCKPFAAFWKVYAPQCMPGVLAGGLLTFILGMGYYITPALLGSPGEQMVSYFIAFFTNETLNWSMAAALSSVLLAATLVLYVFYARFNRPRQQRGAR
ncbi:ABC transporter permease [Derxia gummosa]|uniref:ABC transporter permease n=1 Tax=Derxia gummosa DSM 723 TaxID=1121388 RepID=A0A8B6X9K0_9BURK|nr:ABC transporter permease [Derxia gummosa]